VFKLVKDLRQTEELPIVLLTYCNIIYRFGVKRFIQQAKAAGVDGVVVADLPVEEASDLVKIARRHNFSTIFLVAPTSDLSRIKRIVSCATGFIYYVSLTGTTGARKKLPKELVSRLRRIKRLTAKPVCVGFGISRPEQIKQIARVADGVIVGSAIIKVIEKNLGRKDLVPRVSKFVRGLKQAL
jgi:tryptophan synthase alpha chain